MPSLLLRSNHVHKWNHFARSQQRRKYLTGLAMESAFRQTAGPARQARLFVPSPGYTSIVEGWSDSGSPEPASPSESSENDPCPPSLAVIKAHSLRVTWHHGRMRGTCGYPHPRRENAGAWGKGKAGKTALEAGSKGIWTVGQPQGSILKTEPIGRYRQLQLGKEIPRGLGLRPRAGETCRAAGSHEQIVACIRRHPLIHALLGGQSNKGSRSISHPWHNAQ